MRGRICARIGFICSIIAFVFSLSLDFSIVHFLIVLVGAECYLYTRWDSNAVRLTLCVISFVCSFIIVFLVDGPHPGASRAFVGIFTVVSAIFTGIRLGQCIYTLIHEHRKYVRYLRREQQKEAEAYAQQLREEEEAQALREKKEAEARVRQQEHQQIQSLAERLEVVIIQKLAGYHLGEHNYENLSYYYFELWMLRIEVLRRLLKAVLGDTWLRDVVFACCDSADPKVNKNASTYKKIANRRNENKKIEEDDLSDLTLLAALILYNFHAEFAKFFHTLCDYEAVIADVSPSNDICIRCPQYSVCEYGQFQKHIINLREDRNSIHSFLPIHYPDKAQVCIDTAVKHLNDFAEFLSHSDAWIGEERELTSNLTRFESAGWSRGALFYITHPRHGLVKHIEDTLVSIQNSPAPEEWTTKKQIYFLYCCIMALRRDLFLEYLHLFYGEGTFNVLGAACVDLYNAENEARAAIDIRKIIEKRKDLTVLDDADFTDSTLLYRMAFDYLLISDPKKNEILQKFISLAEIVKKDRDQIHEFYYSEDNVEPIFHELHDMITHIQDFLVYFYQNMYDLYPYMNYLEQPAKTQYFFQIAVNYCYDFLLDTYALNFLYLNVAHIIQNRQDELDYYYDLCSRNEFMPDLLEIWNPSGLTQRDFQENRTYICSRKIKHIYTQTSYGFHMKDFFEAIRYEKKI